jgi:butyryl-CoA dehydrogenase
MAANVKSDIKGVFAGSVPYLKLAGIVFGGWQMARAAAIAHTNLQAKAGDEDFYQAKITTARFFADYFLSQADAHRIAIVEGSGSLLALPEEQF